MSTETERKPQVPWHPPKPYDVHPSEREKRCHWDECPHGENCVHAAAVSGAGAGADE